MKINNLKINGFGKLSNREIKLEDGINIIYGKNETGKSTLLKFIISMFYGLSKNKNGGTIPETEKYEPWNNNEFSGKISYKLDNGEKYEIYRDFKKKNPKIFNENLEDISKDFNIDKTKGNQFFYEQTGLEEEIYTSSVITKQTEVKLDNKIQNVLIQKISNILGTGEDTSSYTSITNKLKKKLNDEVGTANTREKPINIVEKKISELINNKEMLESYRDNKTYIEEKIKNSSLKIEKEQKEIEDLKKINFKKEKLREEENKIKLSQDIINNLQTDIEEQQEEKNNYILKEKSKVSKGKIIVLIILILLALLAVLLIPILIIKLVMPIISIIYIVYFLIMANKKKKENKKILKKRKEIETKIEILNENKEKQLEALKKIKEEYNEKLSKIQIESGYTNLEGVLELIDIKQQELNRQMVILHSLKVDNDNIAPKLEKLVNIEEEIENLQEEKCELEFKGENIKRTLEYLEIAYKKMKEQITPKFTEELSKVMKKISNSKYENVRINTNGEIIVQSSKGEYINAENLSIGTIDQLYLSLRLATIKEITKENMPIILDESFAYYDNERLENILNYLSNEYSNSQIIILTCTNREKEILEKLNIKANIVEL